MQPALKAFFDAFPAHDISIRPRPDGTLLLTLRKPDEVPLSKAIDSAMLLRQASVGELILDLRLSLRRANGLAIMDGDSGHWCRRDLPTFSGEPIHVTAAHRLVYRRKPASARSRSL